MAKRVPATVVAGAGVKGGRSVGLHLWISGGADCREYFEQGSLLKAQVRSLVTRATTGFAMGLINFTYFMLVHSLIFVPAFSFAFSLLRSLFSSSFKFFLGTNVLRAICSVY